MESNDLDYPWLSNKIMIKIKISGHNFPKATSILNQNWRLISAGQEVLRAEGGPLFNFFLDDERGREWGEHVFKVPWKHLLAPSGLEVFPQNTPPWFQIHHEGCSVWSSLKKQRAREREREREGGREGGKEGRGFFGHNNPLQGKVIFPGAGRGES